MGCRPRETDSHVLTLGRGRFLGAHCGLLPGRFLGDPLRGLPDGSLGLHVRRRQRLDSGREVLSRFVTPLLAFHGTQQLFVRQCRQKERGRVHRFAVKQGLQHKAGDGRALRMLFKYGPDVDQRYPLIREEPAARVGMHTVVDLVVRVGTDVVGQGGLAGEGLAGGFLQDAHGCVFSFGHDGSP